MNSTRRYRPCKTGHEYRVLWSGGPDETPPAIPLAGLVDGVTLAPDMAAPALAEMARSLLRPQSTSLPLIEQSGVDMVVWQSGVGLG